MRILTAGQVKQFIEAGGGEQAVWRESRVKGLIVPLIVLTPYLLLLCALIGWRASSAGWTGLIAMSFVAVFVPALTADSIARFRTQNWAMQIDARGILIRLRPYTQTDPNAADAAAVFVKGHEIESAGLVRLVAADPSVGAPMLKNESVELHLKDDDTDSLAAALERIHGSLVTVPAHGIIRLKIRGQSVRLNPSSQKALARLSQVTKLDEGRTVIRTGWPDQAQATLACLNFEAHAAADSRRIIHEPKTNSRAA